MNPSTAAVPALRRDLLDQVLVESPVRPVWLSRHFTSLSIAVQVFLDFISVLGAVALAYKAYRVLGLGKNIYYPKDMYLLAATAVAIGFVLLMERYELYKPGSGLLHIRETQAILRGASWSMAVFMIAAFLAMRFAPARWVVVLAFCFVLIAVIGQRVVYYSLLRRLRFRGYGVDRVLIYGASDAGVRVFRKLAQSPRTGMMPLAFVDDDPSQTGQRVYENSYTRRVSLPVIGTGDALEEILGRLQITHVILAEGESAQEKFQQIADVCEKYGVRISFVPLQYRLNQHSLYYLDLDGLMLAEIRPVEESNVYRVTKRFLDLALGAAMLLVTLPLMALIAVAILVTGGRPVIFAHDRVGQFGRVFRLYKFRTMRNDAEAYAPTPKNQNDGRITPLGRLLRRTSLDELPQLFNVLRGQMSLVGPRPEMPFIVAQYTLLHRERLLAKPGITGLWQISADRAFEIHENIDYDLYYIRNRSLSLDVVILLHTVIFVLRGAGAF